MNECIFCRITTESGASFSTEHIFPQSIFGFLTIENVCKNCNDKLGHEVDPEILRLPDVLRALKATDLNGRREEILKHNYTISAEALGVKANFKVIDGSYKILPTLLPDKSLLFCEDEFPKKIKEVILKDKNLSHLPLDFKECRILELIRRYEKLNPGEGILDPAIGYGARKHSSKNEFSINPKKKAFVDRLIAKIFYEVVYFIFGTSFFSLYETLAPVRSLIFSGTPQKDLPIFRVKPLKPEPATNHFFQVVFENGFHAMRVGFFGFIEYRILFLLDNPTPWDSWTEILKKRIKGVYYQQDIITKTEGLLLIDKDNKATRIV